MATRTFVTITDDIDGSEDAQTVSFAFEGKSYSIDLAAANRDKLEAALAPFIAKARHGSAPTIRGAAKANERDYDISRLREWAAENNVTLPQRGRIPQAIVDEYKRSGGR